MPDSRTRILASIRQSLASARHLPPVPAASLHLPLTTYPSLVAQFASELRALSGIFLTTSLAAAPALVARLLHERNAASVLTWAPEHLPVPGLLDYLQGQGVAPVDATLPHAEPARTVRLAEVEQARVGLTGVEAALADTGTLALRSGPGRPRLASLSVRTHIALFTPQQLYASWAAWWAVVPDKTAWAQAVSNVTLITGPSRTADIEMTLTVGVHGPGEVIAILRED